MAATTDKPKRTRGKPAKRKTDKHAGGRPRTVVIDFKLLDSLCGIQCTGEEVASVMGISYESLNLRIKEETGLSFPEYLSQKGRLGKVSLRRKQFALAEHNVAMAIFLGKNYLGQADKIETANTNDNRNTDLFNMTAQERADRIKELQGEINGKDAKNNNG